MAFSRLQRCHEQREANSCPGWLIAQYPAAAPFLTTVPIKEGHLDLTLGVIARGDAMLKPAVRHFILHLHRAALHQPIAADLAHG